MTVQANYYYEKNSVFVSTLIENDYVLCSVGGTESYTLTDKEDGAIYIAAFDNAMSARKFFIENPKYFYQKIG